MSYSKLMILVCSSLAAATSTLTEAPTSHFWSSITPDFSSTKCSEQHCQVTSIPPTSISNWTPPDRGRPGDREPAGTRVSLSTRSV